MHNLGARKECELCKISSHISPFYSIAFTFLCEHNYFLVHFLYERHNLIYQKAIYNYKSSPWISDIIHTIKDILSYNFYSNIFGCKDISDRIDSVYMSNIIGHRMGVNHLIVIF
jgi:hypothetical protein